MTSVHDNLRAWDARSLEARDTWRIDVPGEVVEDFAGFWHGWVADRDPDACPRFGETLDQRPPDETRTAENGHHFERHVSIPS